MPADLHERCGLLIEELGLGRASEMKEVSALTGGVASDIASLRIGDQIFCAKFALPKLKVAEDWRAPVHRNAAEYAWLQIAAEILPHSAVKLFGRSDNLHGFVMEFVTGGDVYLWKAAMLNQLRYQNEAAMVGDMIGRIHAASAKAVFDTGPFQNRDDFAALRIEPYLYFTASRHPDLAKHLNELASMLYEARAVLVHGDVSPKNILVRDGGPVILDAECATMGDASFDPSFCLNHLVIKAIHLAPLRERLLAAIEEFWRAYALHVDWEERTKLEQRICRLLPALMLARVDGKSPVEYLDVDGKARVRQIAIELIRCPEDSLSATVEKLDTYLKGKNA